MCIRDRGLAVAEMADESHHRQRPSKMDMQLTAVLPEEFIPEKLPNDFQDIVSALNNLKRHIAFLKQLKKVDLRDSIGKKFKSIYVGFKLSANLPELQSQIFGIYFEYTFTMLLKQSKPFLLDLTRALKEKYPDLTKDLKLSGTKDSLSNNICEFSLLKKSSPRM
eukprot:TRINITY_DN1123_c0_g1_i2.p1 TRINITY_DN1123_c0_g1~~TRINITY_DN1123_c0_g1_i2.p1  ORF type:complete len:165 (-),score=31.15 TRINITY_DN1123_c0_g1_i2:500-994(-)